MDRFAIEGKVEMTIQYQEYTAWAYDSLGFYYFLLMDTPEQDIVYLLESATGKLNLDGRGKRYDALVACNFRLN